LFQSLELASRLAATSELTPVEISAAMLNQLDSVEGIDVQYAVIVDSDTLQPLADRSSTAVALIAAKVGSTRLIDNQILRFR
jgi:pantoate--beta-alanine ligase